MLSVAVYSPKGGVGKSTIAVNLAYHAARTSARRTLLWDIDAQGAAGFLLKAGTAAIGAQKIFSRDVDPNDLAITTDQVHLDVLAADVSLRRLDVQLVQEDAPKRLRKLLRALGSAYDRIIIDCPPGLTEISEQIFRAVDLIVIPVSPSPLAMRAYEDLVAHLGGRAGAGAPLLPVLSMVDARRKLHRHAVETHPDWVAIPQASVVERMSVERAAVGAFAPRHPATRAFADLWAQVEGCLIERQGQSH